MVQVIKNRPDLPRGRGNFDWWRLDVGDPASNQTRIWNLQPLHHCSIGYQLSTTWLTSPRRHFLRANRRTQARKDKHEIWNCRYVSSENQSGVQALITKGLIAIVVKNKNGGPDSQRKDSTSQLQWRRQFLNGKPNLNKTQTLMCQWLLFIWGLGCA